MVKIASTDVEGFEKTFNIVIDKEEIIKCPVCDKQILENEVAYCNEFNKTVIHRACCSYDRRELKSKSINNQITFFCGKVIIAGGKE